MNPAPNLFFIGPMGAGKTTIGRRVAHLLGLPFFDLDHEIETRTGATIPLIFDVEGEGGFRQREVTLLHEFAARSGIVLATGGGAVLDANNRQCLHARGFVVFLETTVEEQLARLARDRKRPLLAGTDRSNSDKRERLRELAAKRDPLYREIADLIVPAALVRNIKTVAQQLTAELAQRWRRDAETNASGCAA